ncbi:hypothetical protein [Dictyobacter kobayashii]|uniref:hypothetical protein n=1 Tax=Dictyobacter kobayashii TaxID=2014872 RepID=UPI001386AB11|nr:hypothetical protein [Dictyobacter kobayashii]
MNPYSKSFYVLEINSYGGYRLQRALGNDPARWLTLIDWTDTGAIQPGYGHFNTILVVASQARFQIYMNQQLVVSTFTDTTYNTGLLGFLVGGDSRYGTEAIFRRLAVFQK